MKTTGGRWMGLAGAAILLALGSGAMAETPAGGDGGGAEGGAQFLTDFAGQGWLSFFFNTQDELQEARYVSEGAVALDFALASFGEGWAIRSRFEIVANMGDSVTQNLPFSPKEMRYEISPFAEYRKDSMIYRGGWSHVCQHLIYKEYEDPWYAVGEGTNVAPDVYFNRLYAGVGRREIRPELFWESYFGGESRVEVPRLVWGAELGWYLRSFFGLDDESLYSQNDWAADAAADLRLRLWAGKKWVLSATSRTEALLDVDDEVYWRERVRLEAVFASRGFGSMAYVGSQVLDEHPRDSREGIVEIGASFYF